MGFVAFMGPLPPPVHGFSIINEKVLALLTEKNLDVTVFDVGPKTMKYGAKFARLSRLLFFPFVLLRFIFLLGTGRCSAFYIGISGGRGQIFDIAFIFSARMLSVPVFIHHHSFAYINSVGLHNRFLFWAAGSAEHIVLCSDMARKMTDIYGLDQKNVMVLSNIAFMDRPEKISPSLEREKDACVVGYISNISYEKGIGEYFSLVRAMRDAGFSVSGAVAGPVVPGSAAKFQSDLSENPYINYLGPVYGKEKESFYRSLDVLVFPTKYINEAEPLVLWEAMSYGVMVVSVARGCIECTIPRDVGIVSKNIEEFLPTALSELSSLLKDDGLLQKKRSAAYSHFSESRSESKKVLIQLLDRISGLTG